MAMPPAGLRYPQQPLPARPPAPPAMLRAVRLIYAGAVAGFASELATSLTTHDAIVNIYTVRSSAAGTVHAYVGGALLAGAIEMALWLWMAWKNRSGRPWARILSTVFFGLLCLNTIGALFTAPAAPAAPKLLRLAEWAIGLAAIIFMWRAESTQYYRLCQYDRALRQAPGFPPPPPGYPGQEADR